MNNNYKYNEVMVHFYDVVYDNMLKSIDVVYYVDKLKNAGGPALEIGCGTGRIFCEALRAGVDIYGLDLSDLMLNVLKGKIDKKEHSRLLLGDIRKTKLGRKYKLIIAPFRMFQHLYTVEDQLNALSNIKEHLEDGGRFIFDAFNPDLNFIFSGFEESLQFSGEYAPGKVIRRYHKVKPDPINQQQHITFRFEWDENGDGNLSEAEFYTPLRYFFRYELEHLVLRSGLMLVNIYGDMNENPLNEKSRDFVVVCSK
jgi:SAM-dependent methyltransferase